MTLCLPELPEFLFGGRIIQAPMAGLTNASTVIASCNAGILGSLGAGNLGAADIRAEIKKIRAATDRPFNINLFIVDDIETPSIPTEELFDLDEYYARKGIEFELPETYCPPFKDQFKALLEEIPPVASFTFGILDAEAVNELHQRNIFIVGTATNLPEVIEWQNAGANAICLQGIEAGGHHGTFRFEDKHLSLSSLIEQASSIARVPLIAAGGIMDGASIVSCFNRGASAVQMGTAFLCCNETSTPQPYRSKLLSGLTENDTVITKAFSGRKARGVRNEFIMQFDNSLVSPYPIRNALTQSLRKFATQKGDVENMSLWAGCGVSAIRAMSLNELVLKLRNEMKNSNHI